MILAGSDWSRQRFAFVSGRGIYRPDVSGWRRREACPDPACPAPVAAGDLRFLAKMKQEPAAKRADVDEPFQSMASAVAPELVR